MQGNKPVPAELIDNKKAKLSKETLAARKSVEKKLNPSSVLRCPTKSKLSPDARKIWKRVMKLYDKMDADILSDLDEVSLRMYCESVAIYDTAHREWLNIQHIIVASPSTQNRIDILLNRMNKQTTVINKLAEQLCLTPVGRARMGVAFIPVENATNPINDLFSKKNKSQPGTEE
jgi:P27 family predicted phage terminase small subunit